MTSWKYSAIEQLLANADELTMDPFLTPEGRLIQAQIREVLKMVVVEKIRAEIRERVQSIVAGVDVVCR